MADYSKDPSKLPGGKAGGAASAARPEEDRRESSLKAAVTRRQNQVGPGAPADPGQPQSYNAELKVGTMAVEREGDTGAIKEQMAAADEEAEATERFRDKQDADYDPSK